jgi:cell division protein FtsX
MDQGVQERPILNETKHAVEIVVHISNSLEDEQREKLVSVLEQEDGIISAEFCPLRYHLMLVRYDRGQYSSQDVLGAVGAQNLDARLIGPI